MTQDRRMWTMLGLALGGVALLCALAMSAVSPQVASAEVICIPNPDDTYTQVDGGDPSTAPPGSIILDDGETCPTTVPVDPDEDLPDPPECDPCPEEEPPDSEIAPTGDGGGAPPPGNEVVARDDASFDQPLPATGSDSGTLAVVLAGLAGFAVVMRLVSRRLGSPT